MKGGKVMAFDFSRLKGRIAEKFETRAAFAAYVGLKPPALSNRLRGVTPFRTEEIMVICQPDCLDIEPQDIGAYFFTPKVLLLEQ
jgi:hypothetical protein